MRGLLRYNRIWLLGLCFWSMNTWLCVESFGQNGEGLYTEEMQILEIEERMLFFYDQLKEIADHVSQYSPEELANADKEILAVDTKWNGYYQSRQSEIAEDDSLLQIAANYQLTKQCLMDSIANKRHFYDAQTCFTQAEVFFSTQDSLYQQLYKKAVEYSLVKSLGGELEEIKNKAQVLFAEVQRQYDNAKNSSQEFVCFQSRFQPIEKQYIELKNTSEKIQALEYKPWLQRIKDYLYSFAAVAMILMFLNMLQAKIKAFKQARENAKKLHQMMNDENDYPTI